MAINIIVPSLGESVVEATIVKWHKKLGEQVNIDQLLIELETDKITLEVNATASGIISEIKFNEGDIVSVGEILGTLDEIVKSEQINTQSTKTATIEINKSTQNKDNYSKEQIFSPAAKKIAFENNIKDIKNPTGKDDRITKGDVISTISSSQNKTEDRQIEERVKMTRLRKTIAKKLKESQNTASLPSIIL